MKFSTLTPEQGDGFQENILLTILQLERTFFQLAEGDRGNVLIVCDRGTMDPSACELCVCVCVCVCVLCVCVCACVCVCVCCACVCVRVCVCVCVCVCI